MTDAALLSAPAQKLIISLKAGRRAAALIRDGLRCVHRVQEAAGQRHRTPCSKFATGLPGRNHRPHDTTKAIRMGQAGRPVCLSCGDHQFVQSDIICQTIFMHPGDRPKGGI
ncbi:hypothetical protein AC630_11225 [Bradyrhizobium sp. AS23.2]|nr:hypothetical protein AC630_11225 [Bradyrhizobium sp. AS23.2]